MSDTKYSLPLNIGVQAQFQVGGNVAVGVGLNYTMLKSKYDCLVNKVRYNGKQTLHYIGVPVNVYGVIARNNNFIFYLNGGVMFEKGLKANYAAQGNQSLSRELRASALCPGLEARFPARRASNYSH